MSSDLFRAVNPGFIYEALVKEYGVAYEVPTTFRGKQIILCGPRAIPHICAKESWIYVLTDLESPSWCTIQNQLAWEFLIMDGSDTAIIEVQSWMNHVSFDSIGNAGFSHDLSSLDGTPASMTKIFSFLLHVLPVLAYLPTLISPLFREIGTIMQGACEISLDRIKKEKEEGVLWKRKRCTVKANGAYSMLRLTIEEVVAQVAHRLLTMLCIDSLLQFANKWKHCLLPAMKRLWYESLHLHPSAPEITRKRTSIQNGGSRKEITKEGTGYKGTSASVVFLG
ncbi:hypothetical protein V8B97DRAFT_1918381 [Scleroderma yunnanense]